MQTVCQSASHTHRRCATYWPVQCIHAKRTSVIYFLEKHGGSKAQINPEALALLLKYQWPGNVRELENILERAIIMSGGGALTPADLPSHIVSGMQVTTVDFEASQELHLEKVERDLIIQALNRAGGNKTEAAKLLGVTRRKLYSMIDRLGVEV